MACQFAPISVVSLTEIYNIRQEYLTDDELRFLRLLIDHTPTITTSEYNSITRQINTHTCVSPSAFICFHETTVDPLYIKDSFGPLAARRFYLRAVSTEKEFLESASLCFPVLFFHPRIEQTMKQLSAPLSRFIDEIIFHLSALNDQFSPLFQIHKKENLDKVLEIFSAQEQIAATLEGDAKEAKKRLTFSFESMNGEIVDIICEPHTKLEGLRKKGDSQYRFDRIYFHPGRPDIHDGKILVAHIGKHL
jgi:hypothetical protein